MGITWPTFINSIFIKIPSLSVWHNSVYGIYDMAKKCTNHKKLLYFSINFPLWIGTRITLEHGE